LAIHQNKHYGHSYHSKVAVHPVKAYQTYYPSAPSYHYTNQPTHHYCNIPPDLWLCDSPQAAQQCGVQHQCDSLRFHKRKPIKLTLIYEALCPYCQKFISNQLGGMYQQHKDHLELELIPWGNSRILRDGSFSCNHGKKECDANRLHSCVIDVLKSSGALPFIVCFERIIHHNTVDQAMHFCSAFIRNQYRQIRKCYDGERGIQLQRMAAHKTMTTKPHPILEVPYLLINDYTPSVDNNNLNVKHLPQLLNKWFKLYS
uniref:Gamma interferon inducible lysosomal thiol reductase GILT n=1 Tax=Angiostrongylus cantonensis TaxID=6313 RepID=A0A158P635_ANGCA